MRTLLAVSLFIVAVVAQTNQKAEKAQSPPYFNMTTLSQGLVYYGSGDTGAKLICQAFGNPTPTVKWKRVKPESLNYEDGNLSPFMSAHAGTYQCTASNKYGVALSGYRVVRYSAPPLPASTTVDNIVQEYGPLKMDCRKDGVSLPTPSHLWKKSETEKETQGGLTAEEVVPLGWRISCDIFGTGTLYFSSTLPDDVKYVDNKKKYYHCEVGNKVTKSKREGSPTTIQFDGSTGQQNRPASPAVGLKDQTIKVVHQMGQLSDEILHLFCFFNGYPEITYTWTKDKKPANANWKTMYDGTILEINSIKKSDLYEGSYTCTGTQVGGARSTITYELEVQTPPNFTLIPQMVKNMRIPEGSEVGFKCEATGHPNPTVEMLFNGKTFNDLKKGTETWEKHWEIKKGVFTKTDMQKNDMCVVTCTAKNDVAFKAISGYVNVVSKLKLGMVKGKPIRTNRTKNTFELKCEYSVDPSQNVETKWYHNDKFLDPEGFKKEWESKIVNTRDSSVLKFDTDKFDIPEFIPGAYICVGSTKDPVQTVRSSPYTLDEPKTGGLTTSSVSLWWIAIIVAVLLVLIIIILICCCIRRMKGESYLVDENERKTGNDPEKDLSRPEHGGFSDYQRAEKDPMGGSRASLSGSIKPLDSDDDVDSMAEYGEMDTGKFNEDGSFIGQYLPDKNKNTTNGPPPYSKNAEDTAV